MFCTIRAGQGILLRDDLAEDLDGEVVVVPPHVQDAAIEEDMRGHPL
jgi:hypothetical protein